MKSKFYHKVSHYIPNDPFEPYPNTAAVVIVRFLERRGFGMLFPVELASTSFEVKEGTDVDFALRQAKQHTEASGMKRWAEIHKRQEVARALDNWLRKKLK